MMQALAVAMIQGADPAQTARDISQQIRDQIQAAREEARAAQKAQSATPAPVGTPVIGTIPYDPNRNQIPRQAVDLSLAFFFTVAVILLGLPITRAFARKMDRAAAPQKIPAEVSNQLNQLTQAVDAIALEVERISEGQRFTTRLLSEQHATGQRTMLSAGEGSPGSG
jgi:hypothetical protein